MTKEELAAKKLALQQAILACHNPNFATDSQEERLYVFFDGEIAEEFLSSKHRNLYQKMPSLFKKIDFDLPHEVDGNKCLVPVNFNTALKAYKLIEEYIEVVGDTYACEVRIKAPQEVKDAYKKLKDLSKQVFDNYDYYGRLYRNMKSMEELWDDLPV